MKRQTNALLTALLGGGIALLGAAAPAVAADEPQVQVTDDCTLELALSGYTTDPGTEATRVLVEAAQPAIKHWDWVYVHTELFPFEVTYHTSHGGAMFDLFDEYTFSHVSFHREAAKPAVYADVPAIPGDESPNTVSVHVDGVEALSTQFGQAHVSSHDLAGASTYRVFVDAFDPESSFDTGPVQFECVDSTDPGDDGENPGGGDDDGENPGGGDDDGENPGGGDDDGENPGGGDDDGENPGGGDDDGENPGGGDDDGENPGGGDDDGENPGDDAAAVKTTGSDDGKASAGAGQLAPTDGTPTAKATTAAEKSLAHTGVDVGSTALIALGLIAIAGIGIFGVRLVRSRP
ncbi:hypothetical protein [Agromyces archimandritae]|uniref:LPXTG cell wall anchor domain-containing protein n=1 Tax=Agromyces archimandritae TaxID=2781962 RepID=A0A975FPC5_9MICO|nr:hypothetical protein [Agromyces archimandritae]QTX05905.1 hypothetical protein G127AT_06845 [Agromyces archimandritae]